MNFLEDDFWLKFSMDQVTDEDFENILKIFRSENIDFDALFQKELNQFEKYKNIEGGYFLSTDDFKECQKLIKPKKSIKPRHNLTTLYEKSSFYQYSSLDTNSSMEGPENPILETRKSIIRKEKHTQDNIQALDKPEKIALRTPSVKIRKNKSDRRVKFSKKFKIKLYNFTLPQNVPNDIKVKCPPYKMLLEHTIGVLLLISTQKSTHLHLSHLKWAIFFLKAISKKRKLKQLAGCIKKLKTYVSEKKLTKNRSSNVECKISVETIDFANTRHDSQMLRNLKNLLRRKNLNKNERETIEILTTKMAPNSKKSFSTYNILKEKIEKLDKIEKIEDPSEEPYSYISKKIQKMEAIFNDILNDIKNEKLQLMSSLRTNHGSLAYSLCKIERDLNEILDIRKYFILTNNKLVEALQKLVTINDFLSLFEKRSSLESKFNDSVDSSLRKLKMIRTSIENISETIYSNLIL